MKNKLTHCMAVFMVFALSQLTYTAPIAIGQTLNCPANITAVNDAGQCSAVVNYSDPVASSFCATNQLSLGDVAFTGYIDDGENEYSFVLLVDVPAGTSINFTDRGWKSGGGFRDGEEDIVTWTATTALSAGTEVLVDELVVSVGSMVATTGNPLTFTDLGDQIFAYIGSPPTAGNESNFLAAIHMNGEWDATATSQRTSSKPSVFTDGVTSISIAPEKDNAVYECTTTTGTPSELRAAINNKANWETTNDINELNELPTCGFTVLCTANIQLMAGLASGSNFPVGTTTVTYRATYGDGSTADCSFTVTVNDTENPGFQNCPGNITVNNDAGECGAYVSWAPPKLEDNCNGGSGQSSHNPGDFFDAETTTTVTYSGSDAAGNPAPNCTFTVSVEDTEKPEPSCINKTIAIEPDGTYTLDVADVFDQSSSTDNCGGAVIFLNMTPTSLSCADVGNTVSVKVEVEDVAGNRTNCYAQISVVEGTVLPSPWANSDINPAGGSAIYQPCSGEIFTVKSTGPNSGSNDRHHIVYRDLCGDGEIIAHVRSISGGGLAGVEMRESLAPGSKKIALKTRFTSYIYREYRLSTGGNNSVRAIRRSNQKWFKIIRRGNEFKAYSSSNGSYWRLAYRVTGNFSNCMKVGIFAEGRSNSSLTTAVFDQVSVSSSGSALVRSNVLPASQLDVGHFKTPNISVFPNPASDEVRVSLGDVEDKPAQILIQDKFGRTLKSKVVDYAPGAEETLSINDLPAGIYIINVRQDQQLISTQKLIVN